MWARFRAQGASDGWGLGSRAPRPPEAEEKSRWPGLGVLGARERAPFPVTFPGPESGEHRAGRPPGERRGAAPGAAQDARAAGPRAARRAAEGGSRAGRDPGRSPAPSPAPRTRRPAHDRRARGQLHNLAGPPPGPPSSRGQPAAAGEAGSPRRRLLPAASAARRPRSLPPPRRPAALPASASASPAAGRAPRPFPAAAPRSPRPRPPLTRGRRGSEARSARLPLRRRPPPVLPGARPARPSARQRRERTADARPRAGGRGPAVPALAAAAAAASRVRGSAAMSARLTLSASLAARPPPPRSSLRRRAAAAGPSPRRSTPFSSSAKFLNPFFPRPPIVTGATGSRSGPGSPRERSGPLGPAVVLPARPPEGRVGAAGPRQRRTACTRRAGAPAPAPAPRRLDSSSRGPGHRAGYAGQRLALGTQPGGPDTPGPRLGAGALGAPLLPGHLLGSVLPTPNFHHLVICVSCFHRGGTGTNSRSLWLDAQHVVGTQEWLWRDSRGQLGGRPEECPGQLLGRT